MTTELTPDQAQLLAKINQYSATSRRTHRLATCMASNFGNKWDFSHTAFVGMRLREKGYVTSTKDNSPYAEWNITPLGMAALAEHNNVKVCPGISKNEAPVTVPVPCEYTLFYAGSYHLRLKTEDEALHKAKAAADQGYEVTVCEVKAVAKVRRVLEVAKP